MFLFFYLLPLVTSSSKHCHNANYTKVNATPQGMRKRCNIL